MRSSNPKGKPPLSLELQPGRASAGFPGDPDAAIDFSDLGPSGRLVWRFLRVASPHFPLRRDAVRTPLFRAKVAATPARDPREVSLSFLPYPFPERKILLRLAQPSRMFSPTPTTRCAL